MLWSQGTLKGSLNERVNLLGNQKKKRSHSDKEMRRKERVTENVLDAVIRIISLAIVQNHLVTKIKRPSLKVLGAIAKMTPKTKPTMKLVSWLNRQMRGNVVFGSNLKGKIIGKDGIFFNQSKYIKEMLKKFGLKDSKPTKTPMSTEINLTKDDEADSMDSSKYR
ncbi:hypothetical protein Tco_1512318, partial [Tanacetum coccineum]